MRYLKAEAADTDAISALALETCRQFIFDDTSEEGRQTLSELYSPASIRQRILANDRAVLAHSGEELAGAAAMRLDDCHVYLLFVAGQYHGQGLGRELMQRLVQGVEAGGRVTLNSSLYAVDFYLHLGFEATGPVSTMVGVEYLPMAMVL